MLGIEGSPKKKFSVMLLQKATVVCTSTCFLLMSVVTPALGKPIPFTAAPQIKAMPSDLSAVTLPQELGYIQNSYQGRTKDVVVLVQDAHAIAGAQQSIQDLILFLQDHYKLRSVLLEGIHSELDFELLKSFPEPAVLRAVIDEAVARGEFTGSSSAAVFQNGVTPFVGMENWPLYEKGIAYYQKALKQIPTLKRILQEMDARIEKEKRNVYSKALLEVDQQLRSFRKNKIDLTVVLEVLARHQQPKTGSTLHTLLSAIEADKNFRDGTEKTSPVVLFFRNFLRNYKNILQKNSPNNKTLALLNEKQQAYETQRLSTAEFAAFLLELTKDDPLPSHITERLELLGKNNSRSIQGLDVWDELQTYTQQVKDSLMRNRAERALDREDRRLALFEKLATLEISRPEWEELQTLSKLPAALVFTGARLSLKDKSLRHHLNFYRNAKNREAFFFKKIAAEIAAGGPRHNSQEGSLLLVIAGGYHATAMAQQMRASNISHLLVMPKVKSLPEQSSYQKHMLGEVPWQNYYQVENGKVNMHKAFVRYMRDLLVARADKDTKHLLKRWRDQLIRSLAMQKQLTQAGKYTFFLDEIAEREEANQIRNQWIKNVDHFLTQLGRQSQSLPSPRRETPAVNDSMIPAATYAAGDPLASFHDDLLPTPVRSEAREIETILYTPVNLSNAEAAPNSRGDFTFLFHGVTPYWTRVGSGGFSSVWTSPTVDKEGVKSSKEIYALKKSHANSKRVRLETTNEGNARGAAISAMIHQGDFSGIMRLSIPQIMASGKQAGTYFTVMKNQAAKTYENMRDDLGIVERLLSYMTWVLADQELIEETGIIPMDRKIQNVLFDQGFPILIDLDGFLVVDERKILQHLDTVEMTRDHPLLPIYQSLKEVADMAKKAGISEGEAAAKLDPMRSWNDFHIQTPYTSYVIARGPLKPNYQEVIDLLWKARNPGLNLSPDRKRILNKLVFGFLSFYELLKSFYPYVFKDESVGEADSNSPKNFDGMHVENYFAQLLAQVRQNATLPLSEDLIQTAQTQLAEVKQGLDRLGEFDSRITYHDIKHAAAEHVPDLERKVDDWLRRKYAALAGNFGKLAAFPKKGPKPLANQLVDILLDLEKKAGVQINDTDQKLALDFYRSTGEDSTVTMSAFGDTPGAIPSPAEKQPAVNVLKTQNEEAAVPLAANALRSEARIPAFEPLALALFPEADPQYSIAQEKVAAGLDAAAEIHRLQGPQFLRDSLVSSLDGLLALHRQHDFQNFASRVQTTVEGIAANPQTTHQKVFLAFELDETSIEYFDRILPYFKSFRNRLENIIFVLPPSRETDQAALSRKIDALRERLSNQNLQPIIVTHVNKATSLLKITEQAYLPFVKFAGKVKTVQLDQRIVVIEDDAAKESFFKLDVYSQQKSMVAKLYLAYGVALEPDLLKGNHWKLWMTLPELPAMNYFVTQYKNGVYRFQAMLARFSLEHLAANLIDRSA